MEIGFHASHEQFSPSRLLSLIKAAEEAGFNACLSSDHFRPWNARQGHSGFAWSWLGAAMQTTTLPFGIVCAPGQRYHPAIVAQAAATLSEMFPRRLWVALGSGQNLNESITGAKWPPKEARNQRLLESAEIMRALFRKETVTHHGAIDVEQACLYTLPEATPKMIGAALTPTTARWMGSWADGLITISRPPTELRRVVDAFREGGGEGKPVLLKVQLSFDRDERKARREAWEQWRSAIFDSSVLSDLPTPAQLDAAAEFVRPDDLDDHVRISDSPSRFVEWLAEDLESGVDALYLHNVNSEQENFIETFGAEVIPKLRKQP